MVHTDRFRELKNFLFFSKMQVKLWIEWLLTKTFQCLIQN